MFVRAVWRNKRLVDINQTLREMDVPTKKYSVMFNIAAKEFTKMTRGLLER